MKPAGRFADKGRVGANYGSVCRQAGAQAHDYMRFQLEIK